jgi:SAM-dependent methyltransferase
MLPKAINIGCGNDYIRGWLNVDKSPLVKPDEVIDLEKPLPFPNDTFVMVRAHHIFEHINNFEQLIKELHRVCKNGAEIDVRCPFFSSWGQYNDPTHVRFFSTRTFDYFRKGNYSHEVDVDKDMFDIDVHLNFAIGKLRFLNWLINPLVNLWQDFYVRFFSYILPCSEIQYTLKVIK